MRNILSLIFAGGFFWILLFHSDLEPVHRFKELVEGYSQAISREIAKLSKGSSDGKDQVGIADNTIHERAPEQEQSSIAEAEPKSEKPNLDGNGTNKAEGLGQVNNSTSVDAFLHTHELSDREAREQLKEHFFQKHEVKGFSHRQSRKIWQNLEQAMENLRARDEKPASKKSVRTEKNPDHISSVKKK